MPSIPVRSAGMHLLDGIPGTNSRSSAGSIQFGCSSQNTGGERWVSAKHSITVPFLFPGMGEKKNSPVSAPISEACEWDIPITAAMLELGVASLARRILPPLPRVTTSCPVAPHTQIAHPAGSSSASSSPHLRDPA